MIYSCYEHAEEAIEEALEDGGLPPIFEKMSPEITIQRKCFLCKKNAVYQVTPLSS
ncbi:CxxH/CxxC protein [Salipaludibacillus sp. HK11]|uniref:CxxH/CxxC protein n=1 Tax=Salipaludibacillus sp. HK11 TaxID=3394320 RepID=UPI0039FD5B73